jgi:hypothetical protein
MYIVPGMVLIPQQDTMACWYASAQMLVQWKRSMAQATLQNNPDPSELGETVSWEVSNTGVVNPQIIRLAQLLGLRRVPPCSVTIDYLLTLLMSNGPLWTNGKSHITVIAGADEEKKLIYVYDPWPPHVGRIEWRPFSSYVGGGNAARDTASDAQATFLYNP